MKIKKTQLTIAATISCMVMIFACTSKKSTGDANPVVSFKNDILPIFKTSCALNSDCHSGPRNIGDNVDLDSAVAYSSLQSQSVLTGGTSSILYREISYAVMPKAPTPALSSKQATLILNWVKQGAPNN